MKNWITAALLILTGSKIASAALATLEGYEPELWERYALIWGTVQSNQRVEGTTSLYEADFDCLATLAGRINPAAKVTLKLQYVCLSFDTVLLDELEVGKRYLILVCPSKDTDAPYHIANDIVCFLPNNSPVCEMNDLSYDKIAPIMAEIKGLKKATEDDPDFPFKMHRARAQQLKILQEEQNKAPAR